jgi:hypothetical protein
LRDVVHMPGGRLSWCTLLLALTGGFPPNASILPHHKDTSPLTGFPYLSGNSSVDEVPAFFRNVRNKRVRRLYLKGSLKGLGDST